MKLVAINIDFKAQNVIGANLIGNFLLFSMVVDVELYYWEKLVKIELKDMYLIHLDHSYVYTEHHSHHKSVSCGLIF